MGLNSQVIQSDQTVKHQEKTIIDYRNDMEHLKSLHMECLETTEELSHELDQVKRINEQLQYQHKEVMEELDKISLVEELAVMSRASKYKELKTKLIMGDKHLTWFQSPFKKFYTNKTIKQNNINFYNVINYYILSKLILQFLNMIET